LNKQQIITIGVIAVIIVVSAVVLSSTYLGKDITITKVSAPAAGVHGQNITVTDTLRNKGIIGTGNFDVYFSLSPTKSYSNKILIGKGNINNLGGRAIVQQSTQLTIPLNTTPGTYYILAYADGNNTVKELNEHNNGHWSKQIVIS